MGIPSKIHDITKIDIWFLKQMEDLVRVQSQIESHTLNSLQNYCWRPRPRLCRSADRHMMRCLESGAPAPGGRRH